jgi:hypothetical protein
MVLSAITVPASAQVQIRFGDPKRANYSELHDGLVEGSPAADTVVALLAASDPRRLWRVVSDAMADRRPWNDGLMALTRLAELRDPASDDSVRSWRKSIEAGTRKAPPGIDATDLLPALHAIELERARVTRGDSALLADLLRRIPTGQYDLGDAWVAGRLTAGATDSLSARFLAEPAKQLKIRYLTLLSFSTDTGLIPLLSRIYTAPDSLGVPLQLAIRASDGLLWIGTRKSMQALLDARAVARARGIYADPSLAHAELDFLGNDSTYVIARTGRWLDWWIGKLKD